MAVLFTTLQGIGACAVRLERRLAEYGGQIRSRRKISPRL